jgi:hypothetical protein
MLTSCPAVRAQTPLRSSPRNAHQVQHRAAPDRQPEIIAEAGIKRSRWEDSVRHDLSTLNAGKGFTRDADESTHDQDRRPPTTRRALAWGGPGAPPFIIINPEKQ